jgi:ADP-ribose pyrophosphatase
MTQTHTGDADTVAPSDVRDEPADYPVVSSERRFDGLVWDVVTDEVRLPSGETVTRDVVVHPGAVGIVAVDEDDRVLLVFQYRHPVRRKLWEPPAGLLDDEAEGQTALEAAQRELYEETGYRAGDWRVLLDLYNSPGGTSEALRVFLARRLHRVGEDERHAGSGEEADMPIAWVPIHDVVTKVLAGELGNPIAASGVLAALAARSRPGGYDALRPADAPWPARGR